MADTLIKIIMGIMLLLCGVQDAIKKKIYIWFIIIGTLLIIVCIPFCNTYALFDRIGGVAIGISVIVISFVTKGKIGLGDGALLCVTGLGLGFWGNLELFALGLLFAAIISIGLLIFRLAGRKKSIPFIPFLLISYVFLICASI